MIGFGFSVFTLAIRQMLGFDPKSLFAAGEQGWVYDPSNLSSLFQDAAGTTPVTAMEQPVGLQLDLRNGATLGPQLLTNGSFTTDLSSWTTVATGANTVSWVSPGACRLNIASTGNSCSVAQGSFVAGQWYKLTFDATLVSGGAIRVQGPLPSAYIFSSSGSYVQYFQATNSGALTFTVHAAVGVWDITNVKIATISGNHRYQTTSANRPVVSARVNLLTYTEQLNQGNWAPLGTAVITNSTVLQSGNAGIWTSAITAAASTAYKVRITLSGNPGSKVNVYFVDRGTLTKGGGTQVTLTATPTTYSLQATTGATSEAYSVLIDSRAFVAVPAGDASQTITVSDIDLRPANIGVNLPPYQRVNTSTDYDTAGFPIYIKANGSNQFMVSNAIDFTATDKMTLWAGVRKLSDVNTQMFVESSSAAEANNGAFNLITNNVSSGYKYQSVSRGSLSTWASTTDSSFSAPLTNVIAISNDISGDSIVLRVNKTQVATSSADQGTGNYGNYAAYHFARAGTSLFFNGHDYGSICRGAASSAAQITAAEGWINQRTKAY